jgi:hypothetical protein
MSDRRVAGLVPAIHVFSLKVCKRDVDAREDGSPQRNAAGSF